MQRWGAERCIWMFMCVCVWICQVFMKKEGRRVKRVRVINALWSHESFTSLNYLHTFLLLSCPLGMFLLLLRLTIRCVFPHTLLQSIVHIVPHFSPHLHAHVEALSEGSYLPLLLSSLVAPDKKRIFPAGYGYGGTYWRLSDACVCTYTHTRTPATPWFSPPLCKTHTHMEYIKRGVDRYGAEVGGERAVTGKTQISLGDGD